MLDRQPLQSPVLVEVDDADVGDPADREPRNLREVRLVVERAAEHPGRLGQEPLLLLGEATVLDVGRGADPAGDRAVGVADGDGANEMPAPVAVDAAQPVLRLVRRAGRLRLLPALAARAGGRPDE